jgi:hypothetical protein
MYESDICHMYSNTWTNDLFNWIEGLRNELNFMFEFIFKLNEKGSKCKITTLSHQLVHWMQQPVWRWRVLLGCDKLHTLSLTYTFWPLHRMHFLFSWRINEQGALDDFKLWKFRSVWMFWMKFSLKSISQINSAIWYKLILNQNFGFRISLCDK